MEGQKIVFIGFPESGKTSIAQVIFQGANPLELLENPLKPTKGTDISSYNWLDLNFVIFDTAGQKYQELFTNTKKQTKVFGKSTYIIYLIDYLSWNKKDTKEKILKDIKSLKTLLEEGSYSAELLLFFHKIDLIDDNKRESLIEKVKSLMEKKGYQIYFTSIHPDHIFSLYSSFYKILSCFSEKRTIIKGILDDYIEDAPKSMFYVTNSNDCIVALAMSPNFDTTNLEGTYKLAAQLNLTLERMKSNDRINHLILQTVNELNIIMNYLDLLEEDMKNLICISETLNSNRLIWKAGEMVTKLRKAIKLSK
jgi:GTPase SAR1 family protein